MALLASTVALEVCWGHQNEKPFQDQSPCLSRWNELKFLARSFQGALRSAVNSGGSFGYNTDFEKLSVGGLREFWPHTSFLAFSVQCESNLEDGFQSQTAQVLILTRPFTVCVLSGKFALLMGSNCLVSETRKMITPISLSWYEDSIFMERCGVLRSVSSVWQMGSAGCGLTSSSQGCCQH